MFIIRRFVKSSFRWVVISTVSGVMLFSPSIFGLFGVSTIGPIAYGLIQGTGIMSGNLIAMTKSFVMSGWDLTIQSIAIKSWVIGSIFTFVKNRLFYNKI